MHSAINHTIAWQVAFLAGIVACIVSTVLVFGTSVVTTIVTVSAIIIGVFNALLSPTSSGQKDQNWFLSKLKYILNISRFLKASTLLIWLFTLSLTTYGLLQYYKESRKITIQGIVLTASGQTADDANVTLIINDQTKETARAINGKFAFIKLDIAKESFQHLVLLAQWEDKLMKRLVETKMAIENTPESLSNIVLKLPPGPSPLAINYVSLKGYAVDFLLRENAVDNKLEKALGGQPLIIPNEIYRELRSLINDYSIPYEAGDPILKLDESDQNPDEPIDEKEWLKAVRMAQRQAGKPMFVGVMDSFLSAPENALSKKDIESFQNKIQDWHLVLEESDNPGAFDYAFWKFADREDLTSLMKGKMRDFYLHVTRKNMPPGFCIVKGYYIPLKR